PGRARVRGGGGAARRGGARAARRASILDRGGDRLRRRRPRPAAHAGVAPRRGAGHAGRRHVPPRAPGRPPRWPPRPRRPAGVAGGRHRRRAPRARDRGQALRRSAAARPAHRHRAVPLVLRRAQPRRGPDDGPAHRPLRVVFVPSRRVRHTRGGAPVLWRTSRGSLHPIWWHGGFCVPPWRSAVDLSKKTSWRPFCYEQLTNGVVPRITRSYPSGRTYTAVNICPLPDISLEESVELSPLPRLGPAPSAILFDLDGTLVPTMGAFADIAADVIA